MNAPAASADAIERRNFLLNILEGGLFAGGVAFISPQTVFPALLSSLGGTNVEIGIFGVLLYGGALLPQVFAARYVEAKPFKKSWAVNFGAAHRCMVLLMGLVVLLFGASSPPATLYLLLVLYAGYQVLSGITTPGWFDFFAKVTRVDRRGRLVGLRNSAGGAAAVISGFVLTFILAVASFPLNFAIAFFLAFLLQISSIGVQVKMVETAPSGVSVRRPMEAYLRRLPGVLRENREFRTFLISSAVLIMATMPVSFFPVYALRHFSADQSVVGHFTVTMMAVQVVSGLVTGYLSDRYGYRIVLIISAASLLCATLCALLAPSVGLFTIVYLFLGINIGSELMARYNISIEYGPADQRPRYIGLMNTVLGPFYLSGILGGFLSDTLGYPALFVISATFSAAGLYLLVRHVHDPRALRRA